jgi:hypothetical protein
MICLGWPLRLHRWRSRRLLYRVDNQELAYL